MNISYTANDLFLKITGIDITTFINSINSYTNITLECKLNCSTTSSKIKYQIGQAQINTSDFYISGAAIYVKPKMFGLTSIVDGVYTISITLDKSDTTTSLLSNCAFVDVTFKCKVAAFLFTLVEENKGVALEEKVGTIIHLLHYGLVNASNCSCLCADLCTAFDMLNKLLASTKVNIDCGC